MNNVRILELPSPFLLESGRSLASGEIAFETFGRLNETRSNAVLVMHGLFGHPRLTGPSTAEYPDGGWWNVCVGDGKLFDPRHDFLVCANHLGGSHGSTGPASINPDTGQPYAENFPVLTIKDLVRAQRPLMDLLGIEQWKAITGCSMGALVAMQWMADLPGTARKALLVTGIPRSPAVRIALDFVLRRAARHGAMDLAASRSPRGMALAAMVGLLFWGAPDKLEQRFGNRFARGTEPQFALENEFAIERFLDAQARKYLESVHPLTLVYLSRAMDYFDLGADREILTANLRKTTGEYCIVSYEPDLCYPSSAGRELAEALRLAGREAEHHVIDTPYGHSAFLFDSASLREIAEPFLRRGFESDGLLALR